MQGTSDNANEFIRAISERVLIMTDAERSELMGRLTVEFSEGNTAALYALSICASVWYFDLLTRADVPRA